MINFLFKFNFILSIFSSFIVVNLNYNFCYGMGSGWFHLPWQTIPEGQQRHPPEPAREVPVAVEVEVEVLPPQVAGHDMENDRRTLLQQAKDYLRFGILNFIDINFFYGNRYSLIGTLYDLISLPLKYFFAGAVLAVGIPINKLRGKRALGDYGDLGPRNVLSVYSAPTRRDDAYLPYGFDYQAGYAVPANTTHVPANTTHENNPPPDPTETLLDKLPSNQRSNPEDIPLSTSVLSQEPPAVQFGIPGGDVGTAGDTGLPVTGDRGTTTNTAATNTHPGLPTSADVVGSPLGGNPGTRPPAENPLGIQPVTGAVGNTTSTGPREDPVGRDVPALSFGIAPNEMPPENQVVSRPVGQDPAQGLYYRQAANVATESAGRAQLPSDPEERSSGGSSGGEAPSESGFDVR